MLDCGLGGLPVNVVRDLMDKHLADLPTRVEVYTRPTEKVKPSIVGPKQDSLQDPTANDDW
jgi:hypothetical protein